MGETEAILVKRARGGDRAAFEELVRRTSRLVLTRLYILTGNVHRSEDLLQETLLLAYRSLSKLSDPAGFRPWLLSIANNVLIDAARRDSRAKRDASRCSDTPLNIVAGSEPPPDRVAQIRETRTQVLEALRSLPEEYQMPLALRYLTGANYDEISIQLGLTNGSLRGFLHRGLKMLREKLPQDLSS